MFYVFQLEIAIADRKFPVAYRNITSVTGTFHFPTRLLLKKITVEVAI
jgi:hypothetical protein